MTTLFWIIVIYLLSAAITYPFLMRQANIFELDKAPKPNNALDWYAVARIFAFLPLANIYLGFLSFKDWIMISIYINDIKKIPDEQLNEKEIKIKNDLIIKFEQYNQILL